MFVTQSAMRFILMSRSFVFLFVCVLMMSACIVPHAKADTAGMLFSEYQNRIFQIRLFEKAANNKVSIGSGFQIAEGDYIVTNFHVVSEAVYHPERYAIQLVDHNGAITTVSIEHVDVINDLALLSHNTKISNDSNNQTPKPSIPLAAAMPPQGQVVFSMGNPGDLKMTVVSGTNNGLLPHSMYQRVLFSGSINPGMSGGPAINMDGELIGINVATAGNQLSFLVPVQKLKAALVASNSSSVKSQTLIQRIQQQLLQNQQKFMQTLLDVDWKMITIGNARVAGELTDFTRCWGGTDDDEEEQRYEQIYSQCYSNGDVYVSSSFRTGQVNYEFYWLNSKNLSPWQFYTRYQESYGYMTSVNRADEKDVTNFTCHDDFAAVTSAKQASESVGDAVNNKVTLCLRRYKKFPELYDAMLMMGSVDKDSQGLLSHYSLSGVSKEMALRFTKKFMEHVEWK